MRLVEIDMRPIRIPFRESFRHASADREMTESVLVRARDDSGAVGYGESCPRSYVTGESLRTVTAFFDRHADRIVQEIGDLSTLRGWTSTHSEEIDANPAAWCAIELALLDLFGRESELTVERLLGIAPLAKRILYTAVVGQCSLDRFRRTIERYAAIAIHDFKIKISGNPEEDRARFEILEELNGDFPVRLRLDGNNLWRSTADALAYLRDLDFPIFALEEPLGQNDHAGLIELAEASGVALILDESFVRFAQFDLLEGVEQHFLINLRVSKMGGIIRSLHIADEARRRGFRLIIGAQVGETSLLTRAALTVPRQGENGVEAREGAFGTHLLTRDIWNPTLTFGAGGWLDTSAIGGTGFGLDLAETWKG